MWHLSSHTSSSECNVFFTVEPPRRRNLRVNDILALINWAGGLYGRILTKVKVPITPKNFFRLNKSLHLFETQCAFLPLFNPNIDLLQAVKVTKSGHHLSHDRASKAYGSNPCLTSQTSLRACFQRLNRMQICLWHQTRNRPTHLLARSCDRWWLDFVTFTT